MLKPTSSFNERRAPLSPQPLERGGVFSFDVGNGISFRLYADNRPRNLEIAALQKGMVLLADGEELIEEGAGFGVPIAMYSDHTYFSRTAQIHVHKQTQDAGVVSKIYLLDAISRKQMHGAFIDDGFYSLVHKTFERAYLHRQRLRPVFDRVMQLRKTLGMQTQFVKMAPRGRVTITYYCSAGSVRVHVDLSAVNKKHCREILLLNEQGATFFRKFFCTDRTLQVDRQIGAWRKVTAKQASFSNLKGSVSFTLENVAGAELFSGREKVKDRFSWAGMTYALDPSLQSFDYAVKVTNKLLSPV